MVSSILLRKLSHLTNFFHINSNPLRDFQKNFFLSNFQRRFNKFEFEEYQRVTVNHNYRSWFGLCNEQRTSRYVQSTTSLIHIYVKLMSKLLFTIKVHQLIYSILL